MQNHNICPKCDSQIPEHAPAGICPACLLNAGRYQDSIASTSAAGQQFELPSIEDLAAQLPQLEVLELLGRGGMGAVYKARQPELDRHVAVKILPQEMESTPGFTERFSREARALAKLSHQNIVTVFDFGQLPQQNFIVMEYVDGTTLRHLIDTASVSPDQALQVVRQICDALQYAHGQGVVHRDIKPENILIDKDGQVKIADFGLAKLVGSETADLSLTGTRQIMGTLRYMAPEQTRATKAVDHRADIFSLGVIFYELLTGDLPIGRFQPPSKKATLDARLDEVVLRALEHEPEDRYQQASDVNLDLDSIKSQPHTRPKPPLKARQQPVPTDDGPPTLSSKAVWGAAWFLGFLMVIVVLMVAMFTAYPSVDHAPGRTSATPVWYIIMFGMLLAVPIGLGSVIGSPVLGLMAYNQIKASQGRVYGLSLAIFDILCIPLFLMDIVIFMIALRVMGDVSFLAIAGATLFYALILNTLVYFAVLIPIRKSMRQQQIASSPSMTSPLTTGTDRTRLILLLVCFNVAVAMFAAIFAPEGGGGLHAGNELEQWFYLLQTKYRNVWLISLATLIMSVGIYVFWGTKTVATPSK